MRFLFFIFFPFLLFASSECEAPGEQVAGFLPVEEVVDPELLKKDPLTIEGLVLPEWMEQTIKSEMAPFGSYYSVDLNGPFDDERSACAHFCIRDGNLLVKMLPFSHKEFQCRKTAILATAIYRLIHAKGSQLKNGDFLIYLKDGADQVPAPYPILCFAKNRDSPCILIPDWFALSSENESGDLELLMSTFQQKGDLIREITAGEQKHPWATKDEIAFWRGGTHGDYLKDDVLWKTNPRARIVLFSIDHPNLVFARFTNNRFFRVSQELRALRLQLTAPWISPMESCSYKYQIDVDGWSSGYHRCQWVLRSNCVPIKQESSYIQWFYAGLKPYVHYVPYQSDCSDLADKIHWLRENDAIAYEIACSGQQFARLYLNEEMTHLYLYEVLKRILEKCIQD